uniref:Putative calreticulin n=1 Tax=Ixodes ricinus TaxID=34613 RepID=V5H6E8_IXORI
MRIVCLLLPLVGTVFADPKVYLKEEFADGDGWTSRWVHSTKKGSEQGTFKLSAGKFHGDPEKDLGIQTSEDARFYGLSTKFEPFSNDGKTLVVQFTVKHEQNIDCGGGYVKLFDCSLDQKEMHGESPYHIMFGPDICGPGTKKVHVIFNYKGKNLLINKEIRCKDDVYTHLYTLIVKPDNTYTVKIDNEVVESGELEKDWSFLPPKKIKDPAAKNDPRTWDDEGPRSTSPEDTKPEDWDQPEYIPDPDATKPDGLGRRDGRGVGSRRRSTTRRSRAKWKPKQTRQPGLQGSLGAPRDRVTQSTDPRPQTAQLQGDLHPRLRPVAGRSPATTLTTNNT